MANLLIQLKKILSKYSGTSCFVLATGKDHFDSWYWGYPTGRKTFSVHSYLALSLRGGSVLAGMGLSAFFLYFLFFGRYCGIVSFFRTWVRG